MKLSRSFVGGLVVLILGSLVVVNGLPAYTRKNSRRQMESTSAVVAPVDPVTPVVATTTADPTTEARQASETEVGSIAPIGDLVENTKAPLSTVHTFVDKELEALSTPKPAVSLTPVPSSQKVVSSGNVLPGLESSGPRPVYQSSLYQGPGQQGQGPRPRPTTVPPPVSTTKKPDEEDDSSSEEDGEGPPAGDADEVQNEEDEEDEAEAEDEEDDDDDEERRARNNNSQQGVVVEATATKNKNQRPKTVGVPPIGFNRNPQHDALIPGYVSETGEIFVPIDTLEKVMPYSIIPDDSVQRGRLGYNVYRSDVVLSDDEEEDDDSAADDATSSEEVDDDDDTSSAEDDLDDDDDDESAPVRISSFNVIYKKKKNKDENDVENDDEENEADEPDESEEKENKPDEVDSVEGPSAPAGPTSTPPVLESSEEKPLLISQKTETGPAPRPPLQAIPATRPTNEDDENELRFRKRYLRRFPSYGMSNLMNSYPQYYAAYTDPRRPYFTYEPPQLNAGGYYPGDITRMRYL